MIIEATPTPYVAAVMPEEGSCAAVAGRTGRGSSRGYPYTARSESLFDLLLRFVHAA